MVEAPAMSQRKVIIKEVLPGLHLVSRIEPNGWILNTVLVSDGAGSLLAYSPTKDLGDDIHAQIQKLGKPRYLLSPNHYHHLGIPEWRERYPDTTVLARTQGIPRLEKMYPSLEIRSIDTCPYFTWLEPEGTKTGELWLRANDAWVVCDAFFNMTTPVTGAMGFILKLLGNTPGLRIGRLWRPLNLVDPPAYKSWLLGELDRAPPSWLVPAHGDPLTMPNLGTRLKDLAEERL
jgi:hypothetical protein